MTLVRSISLATAAAALAVSALAAQDDQKDHHRPAGETSAPESTAESGNSRANMAAMEGKMKAMREIHKKMMAAETPEKRNALMSKHTKMMQEAMSMMSSGMGDAHGEMKGDLTARQQVMEKRMEMMQVMMEMMMDRLPAAPAQ